METTASIIVVAQLCERVIEYIVAVFGPKAERQRLWSQTRYCTSLLLKLKDEIDDSDEPKEWTKILQLPYTPLARLGNALSLAAVVLSTRDGLQEKLRWPFKEKDIGKLVEAIKCEMAMVDFALSHNSTSLLIELNTRFKRNGRLLLDFKDALELRVEKTHFTLQDLNSELQIIQTTQNDVRARVEELRGRHDTEEAMQKRQRTLDWLTPVDHALQQRDATSRWQPGTGGWLLCSQMYQD
ncbi:uncharacterized protein ALTATR162_LOCUS2880 [Alternaria atra]|uniref:Uncharacterized protein n=1 Tax=Alternaria atra TaxID=119953 RepID=A0A8J2MXP8_9PLEO|nr:uncharacterized protein ALTATR162_LOCUS2880 [Alternaria atra]CAG5152709.1 unnamed protein product [Alternaria atra]